MSKILLKALRSAILPSSLLVVGKFLSVFILISILGSGFSIDNNIQSFFSVQLYVTDSTEALLINTVSNAICLGLIAIPTFIMLLRTTLLKDAQNNPRVVVKLTRLNILKWVTAKESNLIKVTIWTVFLWIISAINISSTISLQSYSWIGIVSGCLALIASLGILKTFEKETARIYPEDNNGYF